MHHAHDDPHLLLSVQQWGYEHQNSIVEQWKQQPHLVNDQVLDIAYMSLGSTGGRQHAGRGGVVL